MFDNLSNTFNGMFGKVKPGWCRLTMNGNIAVKCDNKYKTYNVKKGTLTNVTNFCFNVGDDLFFVIPTNKVEVGDIIIVNDEPKCVIGKSKNDITVIDYKSSEIKHIVPERHIFMGSVYFYGKIVSMFGNVKKGGLGNMMKMMMMSQMMGGGTNPLAGNAGGGLGQMMAMSMLMGGANNPFDGMFDFDINPNFADDEDEGDDEGDDDEDEVPAPKKAKKTKKVEEE